MEVLKLHARDAEQKLAYAVSNYYGLSVNEGMKNDPERLDRGSSTDDAILNRLETEICSLLDNLTTTVDKMENITPTTTHNTAYIRSLRTRVIDKSSDFARTRESIKKRRDLRNLLSSSSMMSGHGEEDKEASRWLDKERRSIEHASRGIDESIGKANAIKEALQNQASRLSSVSRTLTSFGESIPGVNNVIRMTHNKKIRDNAVVAGVTAGLTILMFWWIL